jgi:hypothetical protein
MDNLKNVVGKTIKSCKYGNDGNNSYLIIKFIDGGKLNLTAFSSKPGTGQVNVEISGTKNPEQIDQLIGKQIKNIEEKFNGEYSHIIMKFTDGVSAIFAAYSSSTGGKSDINYNVYESILNKIVRECLS